MTANQIYALPEAPGSAMDLWELSGCYYSHVPEVDLSQIDHAQVTRVTLKRHGYYREDGQRYWSLASVWLDGHPVMLVQNAGREGDDHAARFITDQERYGQLVGYLVSLQRREAYERGSFIDPDEDQPALTEFYGRNLSEHAVLASLRGSDE